MSVPSPVAYTAATTGPHQVQVQPSVDEVNPECQRASLPRLVNRRVLTTLSVAALCYFNVSGGPVGSSQIFSAGGPLLGLIALAIFPFIYCIPLALVTAELSTTYPENGGFTVWVFQAFGPFWGFQEGLWAWVSGAIDNAIYPALTVQLISTYDETITAGVSGWFLKVGVALVYALPNIFGVRLVGWGMVTLAFIVLVPFIIFTIWAYAAADDWSSLHMIRRNDTTDTDVGTGPAMIQWDLLINTLFWNYNGFANASVFGGEVANPSRTYPRALMICTIAVMLTYLFPLSASAVYNSPTWQTWDDEAFSSIAQNLGGNTLLGLITVATVASNWGQYSSQMFVVSYQLTGMAECGLAPKIFLKRAERTDVPYISVALSFLVIVILVGYEFEVVVNMTNAVSSMSIILLLVAAIKLRVTHPNIHRPYKVPVSTKVLALLLTVPVAMLCYIVYTVFALDTIVPGILVGVVIIVGALYAVALKLTPKHFVDPKATASLA
ncbi:hypothetical protein SDRG_16620 [Saprolegnia diclina VS20]|uniref:Amino acid permease/ SLC12A domain-containing protein n=1 Tax=Saprolegnia diclina (strain VS20) TaxID=1156394 RepID=T0PTG7_SAPDV|nr:hypothetical protein SDRG_16620 [Saprolegnia diclina VS20]EQC25516.1 hypothetical protein SDRG_16620 [Saprolegnia diclina VS20]|eukprot:XP_008621060.1 hypothetical protein SDRG_16620 [Saprolegnia diclina VS20]